MGKTIIKGYFHVQDGYIDDYFTSKRELVDYMEMIRFMDYSKKEMRGFNRLNLDGKIGWMIDRQFADDAILLNPTLDMLNEAIQSTTGSY